MSVIYLADFKAYLRELTTALDDPLQMALDAAIAEASGFVGFDLDEAYGDSSGPPSDLAMAVFLLAQTHADAGGPADNEYRRGAAQKLLTRYRVDPGFVGVGAVADEPEGSE